MSTQTTFDLDDANELLNQLVNFHEVMQKEWSRVENQWFNLRSCWRDEQYQMFEPLYDQLSATHKDSEKECLEYIAFMREQVRIAAERRAKLGALKGL